LSVNGERHALRHLKAELGMTEEAASTIVDSLKGVIGGERLSSRRDIAMRIWRAVGN